jgi:hypothetical protein
VNEAPATLAVSRTMGSAVWGSSRHARPAAVRAGWRGSRDAELPPLRARRDEGPCRRDHAWSCSDGAYEIPMIAPSGDWRRATVWPHGSSRAGCSSSCPPCCSSRAAASTAAASLTSNSMLTCGTGRSVGQRAVPKHASAACESGQTPKCLQPRIWSLWWYSSFARAAAVRAGSAGERAVCVRCTRDAECSHRARRAEERRRPRRRTPSMRPRPVPCRVPGERTR